jgi:hypothetical protein
MRIRLNRQTVTQAALTVVLLTILCAVYLARPQHAGAPLDGFAQQGLRALAADDGDEDSAQGKLEELQTLPAYRSAQRAVAELNAARAALLKAAAAADAPATRNAADDYHRTLEQVRSAVATLKDYVDPAEFQRCLHELFMPHTEAELSGVPIQESLLGILPRVSVLPEENLP